jgi:DNA repair photolyase
VSWQQTPTGGAASVVSIVTFGACRFLQITEEEFNEGAVMREDFLPQLYKSAKRYQCAGLTMHQVMMSFLTDPYHNGNCAPTTEAIKILQGCDLGFCALSKGGAKALQDIDLYRPARDSYACTLTCMNLDVVKKWERLAAPPAERMDTCKEFHRRGIYVWVSCEPCHSIASTLEVIEKTHTFVDLYKVGKTNHISARGENYNTEIDHQSLTDQVRTLTERLGKQVYYKKDLQMYLPPGYPNPMRRAQHH